MRLRRGLRLTAMLAFTGLFFALVFIHKSQTARVLIIHSYDPDYKWVEMVNEGLARGFTGTQNVLFRNHYMDLKNHSDEDFTRKAATLARKAVDDWSPDVLILIDDPAQDLVGRNLEDGPDIVFAGVNGDPRSYYPQTAPVTGILERKPLDAIKETILTIAPNAPRVRFIGDTSSSITAEIPYYSSIDWSPIQWLDPVQVDTLDQWQAAVTQAGQDADLILVTNYRQIRDGKGGPFVRPANQVMHWTQANAAVPVLGIGASNSEDGAMLTVSVSPYEQGEVAAKLTRDILRGARPGDLPVVTSKQFIVQICAPAMARWSLKLPALYEAMARATDNFFEKGC